MEGLEGKCLKAITGESQAIIIQLLLHYYNWTYKCLKDNKITQKIV